MERHVILASHGGLAEGVLDTLRLIIGDTGDARAWGLRPGHSATELVEEISPEIAEHPQDSYILIADLYGASVFTALCQLLSYPNVKLLTGLNAALAISALTEGGDAPDTENPQAWIAHGKADVRHVTVTDLTDSAADQDDDF